MNHFCQYFVTNATGKAIVGIAALTISAIVPADAWATPTDRFPPNPLELKPDDPLQPSTPLAAAGRDRLRQSLITLHQQALAQLQAGDDKAAFDLWNRELRLSRSLGPIEETKALARVGSIAWEKSNTQQVRYISQRLQHIQTEHSKTPNSPLLTELAAAYQVIRAPELAVNAQQTLLQEARQTADPLGEFRAMNAIGQTHLDWFGYKRAAKIYQELLEQARGKSNRDNQIAYLYQLAYIHEQTKNPQAATVALQELIPLYTEVLRQQILQNPTGQSSTPPSNQGAYPNILAHLQIRLGNSAAATQQTNLAELAYQTAYNTAQSQVQLGYAGDALRQLGKFYRSQKRDDAAIQVYDFLSDFEQDKTQNLYNAMDAYDQMGQIFLENQKKEKALAAFQRGLQVAQALSYRTGYFGDRISEIEAKGAK